MDVVNVRRVVLQLKNLSVQRDNQPLIARNPGVIQGLLGFSRSPFLDVAHTAMQALENLSSHPRNIDILVNEEGLVDRIQEFFNDDPGKYASQDDIEYELRQRLRRCAERILTNLGFELEDEDGNLINEEYAVSPDPETQTSSAPTAVSSGAVEDAPSLPNPVVSPAGSSSPRDAPAAPADRAALGDRTNMESQSAPKHTDTPPGHATPPRSNTQAQPSSGRKAKTVTIKLEPAGEMTDEEVSEAIQATERAIITTRGVISVSIDAHTMLAVVRTKTSVDAIMSIAEEASGFHVVLFKDAAGSGEHGSPRYLTPPSLKAHSGNVVEMFGAREDAKKKEQSGVSRFIDKVGKALWFW